MITYRQKLDENKCETCGDIGISSSEWFSLLQETKSQPYIYPLLCFLRAPKQQCSCVEIGHNSGKSPQYFNSKIVHFSKWVKKTLNRFEVLDELDQPCFWPITMIRGWKENGFFIWQLRPELTEALRQYLIENLIQEYRKGCRQKPFCGMEESFKWRLIERNSQASTLEIVESLFGVNLIDSPRVNKVLKDLLENKKDAFLSCVERLFDESVDLKTRLEHFKKEMPTLCPSDCKVFANDERTAAALLTCKYPDHYTFYKNDVYRNFCEFMGIESRKAGEKYIHFMEMVRLLTEKYSAELHQINEKEISQFSIHPPLLETQTLLWCMKDKMLTDNTNEMKEYTWIPFYKEMANKLLAYRDHRKELLDLIYAHKEDMMIGYLHDKGGAEDLFIDIDPFTVFGIFNRREKRENRLAAVQVFKEILKIDADVPSDFTGIPVLHPQKSHFFGFKDKRSANDIENLWELFDCVISNRPFHEIYNQVISQYIIQINISMGLFWIRPEDFLALDNNNKVYMKEQYHIIFPSTTPDYQTYTALLAEIKNKMKEEIIHEKTFYEISANAFSYGVDADKDGDGSYYNGIVDTWKNFKNIVLYGAPGTGKTYDVPEYVVRLCCPNFDADSASREELEEQYQLLKTQKRVSFTTFHQSMDYEEWIEGLQPQVTSDNLVIYECKDGIFKNLCSEAEKPIVKDKKVGIADDATIWKVSLKGTGDNPVRKDCMNNGYIRIGWDGYGPLIDETTDWSVYEGEGRVILDNFINKMNNGDIVMSCYSSKTVDAIGVVIGEYEWHDEFKEYQRLRRVKWLVKNIDENIVALNDGKQMTLSTVYRLNSMTLDKVKKILDKYGSQKTMEENTLPYVMVIDEFNRGNVSKIFGETITLLEKSKRKGNQENAESVILPYSQLPFQVPDNVYIIATMNTADRSLGTLDYAIRRRFAFIPCYPYIPDLDDNMVFEEELFEQVSKLFIKNYDEYKESGWSHPFRFEPAETLAEGIDPRDVWIGHSYFIRTVEDTIADNFNYAIMPLLEEYVRDGVLSPDTQETIDELYDKYNE